MQGNLVEVLRLRLISFVEVPEDRCVRIAMSQFHRYKTFTAIHLSGQFDTGVHRRINKLHCLEGVFPTAGFERRKRFVFRVMLLDRKSVV